MNGKFVTCTVQIRKQVTLDKKINNFTNPRPACIFTRREYKSRRNLFEFHKTFFGDIVCSNKTAFCSLLF